MCGAIIYVRVSTDGQEREGTSLDTQEEACLKYAESQNWTVVTRVHDTGSGFSLERKGLEEVRSYVRDGLADVVLAYAVDRLSRNQSHIGILVDEAERYGTRLDFVTEDFEQTAVGKFILSARAFVAEMEREKIVERTTRGKTARAKSGRIPQANGRGLYGYHYNRETGKREVDEYQAAVVRRVFDEKRLLKLFMLDDISEEALREEASNLKRQREQFEDRLQTLRRTRSDAREPVDPAHLCLIGRAIEAWLENADAEQWTLVLEALQVTVEATRQRVILRGILPGEVPKFITIEQTSA